MLFAELAFNVTRALRALRGPVIALLAIELLDELVFGAREAAWPALRDELDLSYAQIGVLLSVPTYSSALLEPVFGVLGDSRWRRTVVIGGGIGTATALTLVAGAPGFVVLLVAFALLFPSTGAFASLSQATLMDLEPERRELNMTRWSIAGGVGAVAAEPANRRRGRLPCPCRRSSGPAPGSRRSPRCVRLRGAAAPLRSLS
jgi:MFS family permease